MWHADFVAWLRSQVCMTPGLPQLMAYRVPGDLEVTPMRWFTSLAFSVSAVLLLLEVRLPAAEYVGQSKPPNFVKGLRSGIPGSPNLQAFACCRLRERHSLSISESTDRIGHDWR